MEKFSLPIITIHLPLSSIQDSRVRVDVDGESMTVESGVARVFEKDGYTVFSGQDVHLASAMMAGTFHGYFAQHIAAHNAGGLLPDGRLVLNPPGVKNEMNKLKQMRQTSRGIIKKYINGDDTVTTELFFYMIEKWRLYFMNDTEKMRTVHTLREFFVINPALVRPWVTLYADMKYNPCGVPDLWVWCGSSDDWYWLEVKSETNGLRPDQWAWLNGFMQVPNFAPHAALVRVLTI